MAKRLVQQNNLPKQARAAGPGAQTVGRALQLIKLLALQDVPPTLSEIVAISGIDKSSTYRLLREMEAHGFVSKNSFGHGYLIGSELLALSGRIIGKLQLRELAHPFLERIALLTGETVILNIRVGHNRLTVDGIEAPHSLRMIVSLGELLPLYATPSGRVMLAFLPDEERVEIISAAQEDDQKTEELANQLGEARANGCLLAQGKRRAGHSVLAIPIFTGRGVVAAIVVSGPVERWNKRVITKIRSKVLTECAALSKSLGYSNYNGGAGPNGPV